MSLSLYLLVLSVSWIGKLWALWHAEKIRSLWDQDKTLHFAEPAGIARRYGPTLLMWCASQGALPLEKLAVVAQFQCANRDNTMLHPGGLPSCTQ